MPTVTGRLDVRRANVVAARLTGCSKGWRRGRSLVFTVAVITVIVWLAHLILMVEPLDEATGVDAGETE